MKKKYIILLSCLAVLILLLCFVEADYQTYLRETSEATAIVEVKEGLSINYIDGKSFEVNSPSKSITFSVTNLTEDNVDYYIHINNVVGDITGVIYELSEAESEDVISNEFGTSSVLSESISAGATERYTLMVRNPSNRDFTFDLNVELEDLTNIHNKVSFSLLVENLPKDLKLIFYLRYKNMYTIKETSKITKLSESTIKRKLSIIKTYFEEINNEEREIK